MNLDKRIEAFSKLGEYLRCFRSEDELEAMIVQNNSFEVLCNVMVDSYLYNGWFVEQNVKKMLLSLGESMLDLNKWLSSYKIKAEVDDPKQIAVIMAGNIPAVGFHDYMSVLLSGNKLLIKLSSDDDKLIPAISQLLFSIEPEFESFVAFADGKLSGFDAVIATGSGNTSRYFDYYFGKYPNIIRRNRNGVAVINGSEKEEDFEALADDIFMYFGLGCRNVSKLYVPQGYDFVGLLDVLTKRKEVALVSKYFNNYEYNKAIYLVNSRPHFDAANILMVEDTNIASPVSVVHYEYYNDITDLNNTLKLHNDAIQCVVGNDKGIENIIDFGKSQQPGLMDYADGVDTIQFLIGLD